MLPVNKSRSSTALLSKVRTLVFLDLEKHQMIPTLLVCVCAERKRKQRYVETSLLDPSVA